MEVSSRDETPKTSGCTQLLSNALLKTAESKDEETNYNIIQMSGGNLTMNFDQERAYFKAQCMEHDAPDLFEVLTNCALKSRRPSAINV